MTAANELTLRRHWDDGTVVLELSGRLDTMTVAALEAEAKLVIKDAPKRFVLDLAGLEYVGSAGLRAFLVIGRDARPAKIKVALAAATPFVQDLLKTSGVLYAVPAFPDRAKAIGALM